MTHVHTFAKYPVEQILAQVSLVYITRMSFILLRTRRPFLEDCALSIHHHAYTKDVTAHLDVILGILRNYTTNVRSRSYTHEVTLRRIVLND